MSVIVVVAEVIAVKGVEVEVRVGEERGGRAVDVVVADTVIGVVVGSDMDSVVVGGDDKIGLNVQ